MKLEVELVPVVDVDADADGQVWATLIEAVEINSRN